MDPKNVWNQGKDETHDYPTVLQKGDRKEQQEDYSTSVEMNFGRKFSFVWLAPFVTTFLVCVYF